MRITTVKYDICECLGDLLEVMDGPMSGRMVDTSGRHGMVARTEYRRISDNL